MPKPGGQVPITTMKSKGTRKGKKVVESSPTHHHLHPEGAHEERLLRRLPFLPRRGALLGVHRSIGLALRRYGWFHDQLRAAGEEATAGRRGWRRGRSETGNERDGTWAS